MSGYSGKWVCDKCGHVSDNEHDPCDCDVTCTEHIETIDALRTNVARLSAESDALRARLAAVERERDEARGEIEVMSAASMAEFYKYKERRNEQFAAYEVLAAQFAAASATVNAECVEHAELNGHIETATFAHEYLLGERDKGDPSGRLHDFVTSLSIVIHQLDRQRRRANWYEAAHTAGKQKLIESAVAKALEAARAAAQVYAARVDALGLAADDSDPLVMATAEPIGAAQADLFAALGLLVRDASGKASAVDPPETVEQLRAERDTARTLAEVRARDIPEQIAAWLERKSAILATEANSLAPVISDVAAAIRKGSWKP